MAASNKVQSSLDHLEHCFRPRLLCCKSTCRSPLFIGALETGDLLDLRQFGHEIAQSACDCLHESEEVGVAWMCGSAQPSGDNVLAFISSANERSHCPALDDCIQDCQNDAAIPRNCYDGCVAQTEGECTSPVDANVEVLLTLWTDPLLMSVTGKATLSIPTAKLSKLWGDQEDCEDEFPDATTLEGSGPASQYKRPSGLIAHAAYGGARKTLASPRSNANDLAPLLITVCDGRRPHSVSAPCVKPNGTTSCRTEGSTRTENSRPHLAPGRDPHAGRERRRGRRRLHLWRARGS